MELLDFFNSIADHLINQGIACKTKAGKPLTYKGSLKDPLGFLLKKSKWKKEFDRLGIYNPAIAEILQLTPDKIAVVEQLQAVHDLIKPEEWPTWIALFRKAYEVIE